MTAEEQHVPARGARRMTWEDRDFEFPELPVASLSDIDEFLKDGGERPRGSLSSEEGREMEVLEDDGEREDSGNNVEDSKKFWETQHQLLQGVLCRSTSTETRIRNATKEALKEVRTAGIPCGCRPSTAAADCRRCLVREVCVRLQRAGFNAAICKSKWRSSSYMPSGEHTFMDVVDDSAKPKKGEVRVVIELNFRAEFVIARACSDYDRLVQRLPEVFVGKVERLQGVIKILCAAAKKCMKEKKMHMGPWRKHSYMQAKWLGACERVAPLVPAGLSAIGFLSEGRRKPRASMLTLDLHEKLSDVHRTAVEVV
ncbi:uncharacterized protein LOC115739748 [Rhodamnia argentea]|uniref:Uncharacterized protein LOC115739748 n=1 Tax=Rhodamnia argentea TaxID=178133 RepID=A0A8B8P2P8_9MYRT|nr:uncharacterized protein LOC115739748 [Rhodamnia argentea]